MRSISLVVRRLFSRRYRLLTTVFILFFVATGVLYIITIPTSFPVSAVTAPSPPDLAGPYAISRQLQSHQTIVKDSHNHWLATFSDQARTVRLTGPSRTFAEASTTSATVTHSTWVRVLPQPFDGTVDQVWLRRSLADTSPDILAIAMQYIVGTPTVQANGMTISSDASYGPIKDGKRDEGSDFNDYLGIDRQYPTGIDKAEAAQKGAMDCSGFIRMVWGYRAGLPLAAPDSTPSNSAIPRRAYEIQAAAPGTVISPNTRTQLTDFSSLNIGDIVFFDANKNDGQQIDHNGMYIGVDNRGHYRFISSRKTADGPTMGDVGGASVLDGHGLYATAYRSARRF